jgi:two-component system CheB/CheR fusion protein
MPARKKSSKKKGAARTQAASKKPKVAGQKKTDFYVVGIGGSAGSLEALEQFFSNTPSDTGMAFVIVQHLDPKHKDIMPEILQRVTKMKVFQAKDAMQVQPNRVYVIPPNKDMSLMHGKLHLLPPTMTRGIRMPIDFFLRSLANDREEKAIAVILSGMGTDGTLGVKEVKAKLGMAMVQSVDSAKFDGMPKSAADTGLVDYVAPATELPAKLIGYVRHFVHVPKETPIISRQANTSLQKIFVLLRNRTGHDFSFYKKNTVYRRIERRMNIHQLSTIAKYLRYLQINPQELDLLFKELLIGVTNFFRDPDAFETLKKKSLPMLFKARPKKCTIRAWVVGCSTGEEAYSLAILLSEYLEATKQSGDYAVQIFATDIDKDSVDKARMGVYPANISADVSSGRLHKYFTKQDDDYRVKKSIRELVVFAPQDVITDPPFTKLDLIVCRNLLIYLTFELQKKLLPLFHYALNPSGLLFLGGSETIGSFGYLFKTIDNKWKIFSRKEQPGAGRELVELPSTLLSKIHEGVPVAVNSDQTRAAVISEVAQERLLDAFAPPTVFINEQGDILYIHGKTGKYLELATGKTSMNVFSMAREGIRFELASAVRKAVGKKMDLVVKDVKVKTDGEYQPINLIVKPFTKPASLEGIVMLAFEEISSERKSKSAVRVVPSTKHKSQAADLEQELRYTKEHLRTTIEEMETSQEELKSTNEELQSTNEELQSTNEELTTSKEELQSLNEELVTVNAELQNKVDELTQANNDMKNLLNSTDVATIFLDNDLNVKRFTPSASKITHLIPSDVGRPIEHIVSKFKYGRLREDVKEVLATLASKEIQIETMDDNWFLMRIMPYRTSENVIDGVVITFANITEHKKLEESLRKAETRCHELLEEQTARLRNKD